MTVAIVIFALLGVLFLIALTRTGSVHAGYSMARRITVHTAADPDAAYRQLAGWAHANYRLDDRDDDRRMLVLSSPITLTTWGFVYPVYVTPGPDGGSAIDIGIKSKVFQVGPLVTRAHKRCAAVIEDSLTVPEARVVAS